MARKTFEKVTCPKCGRAYAVIKGATKAFHCPGRNCHEMVNASATPTGKQAEASSKA
jgi:ribosomal protein S27E